MIRRLAYSALLLVVGCHKPAVTSEPCPEPVAAFTYHYVESDHRRPFSAKFLGVPTWQNPCDMWVMQELLTEIKPDILIEAGTAYGGASLYFASVLEQLGGDGKVITIDIEPKTKQAEQLPLWQKRIELIVGDSTSPETLAKIKERIAGKKVMVTLDSLHTTAHVAKELSLYADLVTPGSYLVVQDTVIDQHKEWIARYASYNGSTSGPAPAVADFLQARQDYVVDRSREKFLFTFYPGGFLQRKP